MKIESYRERGERSIKIRKKEMIKSFITSAIVLIILTLGLTGIVAAQKQSTLHMDIKTYVARPGDSKMVIVNLNYDSTYGSYEDYKEEFLSLNPELRNSEVKPHTSYLIPVYSFE